MEKRLNVNNEHQNEQKRYESIFPKIQDNDSVNNEQKVKEIKKSLRKLVKLINAITKIK